MASQVMLGGVARNVCREGRILSSGSSTSLIPTSLAFLSTTSSSEAQEALKHVDRLDRNRDGTKRLNYAIVGPSELATVNKLLYATYHPYEPLTSHLGLCKGPNSIKDMDKMVESYLVKNLTLIAYDRGTGRPVGAAVNNSCLKEELDLSLEQELKEVEDKSYQPRNVCREGRILSSGSSTSLIPTSLAFLSTPSSSEAQEALKHVDRLDRNRDGTKRLNYAIVGPSELATVNKLLYATYHPYEPLTSHLGLCKGPNSIKDMDKMVES